MNNLHKKIQALQQENGFSGTLIVRQRGKEVIAASYGFANRSEKIKNHTDMKFGIASGCKIFTAIAISQLVDEGKLTFESKLKDILPFDFPHFDEHITVHHLLTHTSGVPDYFDEEVMNDFEELWIKTPMYHIRSLKDFLPLFQNEKMKSAAREKFSYNNSGFILLGLIVEQVSGKPFDDYVTNHIFVPAGMEHSGYYEMDRLPEGTATGYIDVEDGSWKTNVYALPAKGGSDGGAYVTAPEMLKLWDALTSYSLISEENTKRLLTLHATEEDGLSYGYGLWVDTEDGAITNYLLMGYDPGVNFHASFYPEQDLQIIVCANISKGAYGMISLIQDELV